MEHLKSILTKSGLVTEECFATIFYDYDILNTSCLKGIISKCLGYGIIAGSLMVKLPQIIKISGNKSGKGINMLSICLEIFCITATMAYSFRNEFPFSAWGESLFLGLQTAIVAALVIFYGEGPSSPNKGNGYSAIGFLAVYALFLAILLGPLAPLEALWVMQAANVPLILLAKSIQAKSNFQAKSYKPKLISKNNGNLIDTNELTAAKQAERNWALESLS
ncbi:hypothetical protein QYM36_008686 [Artemia franciscana]|uniref:Solute carrier family 66 member 3 n=1 Tax=Artemia franciscana TaxID=6661 RepID=A0AA88HUP1_ARTSF|nr:hypothetical protein QYM36_008686 [Artemia franciscana]